MRNLVLGVANLISFALAGAAVYAMFDMAEAFYAIAGNLDQISLELRALR